MSEENADKKASKKEQKGFLGMFKPEPETEVKTVTVKQEKKKLLRVVKPKPMARKHMSEALNAPELTEKDLEITESVIESISSQQGAVVQCEPELVPGPTRVHPSFRCFQCASIVPAGADRCPKCNVHYLLDVSEGDIEELTRAEAEGDGQIDEFVPKADATVIHFDAETGMFSYLDGLSDEPDFVVECSHCGTQLQFDASRCPMCGAKLESGDTGLVGLFEDMEFDDEPLSEVDCPYCGEHVDLKSGKCPACGGTVDSGQNKDQGRKVCPLLRGDNVVFLHLDVDTGELNYLQRLANRLGLERVSVCLSGVGKGGFEEDWKSLSRI